MASMNLAPAVDSAASSLSLAPSQIFKRRAATWRGVRAEVIVATDYQPFEFSFRGARHLLIATERSERKEGETEIDDLRSSLRNLTRKLSFVPANSRFRGWQDPRVLTRFVCFYLDPHGPPLTSNLRLDDMELGPRLHFFDADVWETVRKLRMRVEEQRSSSDHYAEALGVVLCHEVFRLCSGRRTHEPRAIGGLAAWQRERVVQYIAGHLSENVSLSRMAEL